jgi:hypothetical protein
MPAPKRITDLTDYTSILPYASELFGVYQALIGWRSKRQLRRFAGGVTQDSRLMLQRSAGYFTGRANPQFNVDHQLERCDVRIGTPGRNDPRQMLGSVLFAEIDQQLRERPEPPRGERWGEVVSADNLTALLEGPVCAAYVQEYTRRWRDAARGRTFESSTPAALKSEVQMELRRESALAGLLMTLGDKRRYTQLETLFYGSGTDAQAVDALLDALPERYDDPFLTFDPTSQIKDVTLSPIGIVHLFRQYFFELDTFLGTPVSHVWLSPGTTVELLEVSTRRQLVDKVIGSAFERNQKEETATTSRDELSEAVKDDNRSDTKLGFSTSVNQSWGTGSATANASIDLNKTQQVAREQAKKHMHEQSSKLSVEIRQSFKSTFKTVTETIDTSSKRYVISNPTGELINYELRRKMRQVGVQIQDVGTYLCWQTFVDDPGDQLALPNLIHIAKPADLVVVPQFHEIPMPQEFVDVGFTAEAIWNFPDNSRQYAAAHPDTGGRFVPIATYEIVGVPADYEVALNPADPFIPIAKTVMAAEDEDSWNAANWGFLGMITPDAKFVKIGVMTESGGLAWDDRITFKTSGSVRCRLKAAKRTEITAANDKLLKEIKIAELENQRKLEEAYLKAVHERVTLASQVTKRSFEHLREEERTIVYRNLIRMLMSENLYVNTPENASGHQTRHVLSELINAIFDIDKMLYFVAPEWWKPRRSADLMMAGGTVPDSINGSVVRWADDSAHGKYFITDKSDPAPLGASLGWLLQMDGDDLRNAFLNAPWVKAVIPIRPGKEQAAIQWLKSVGVEGSDGLDAAYAAPAAELDKIREELLAANPNDPVDGHAAVTIDDAIRHLCLTVAKKHQLSMTVGEYPSADDEDDIDAQIDDSNRVSSTPIDKVYEHGFYPLKGGFKAITERPFEVVSQWIEILPTDQVVPVEVKYDPKTGRLL